MYLRAKHGVMFKCKVIITYSRRFSLTTGASTLLGRWERRISPQFGGSSFSIIKRPCSRRPHRHSSTTEIVNSTKTTSEYTIARVSLHQTMGRREESCAIVLREDTGRGIPKGGRWWLSCCYLIWYLNKYMIFE